MADIARRRGIEHVVLAAPRGDAHAIALGGDEVVELVCVDPGGVDDHARSEAAFVRPYDPASAGAAIEAEDLLVESEVDAVDARALREGDGELKGVDDPRARRPQGRDRLVRDVRLEREELVSLNDAQVVDAVRDTATKKLGEPRARLVGGADDQRSDPLEVRPELLAERGHEPRALDVEPRHEATRLGVEAGVDDRRVRLGGPAADVLLALDDAGRDLEARELSSDDAAADTGAHDHDVVVGFRHSSPLVGNRCRYSPPTGRYSAVHPRER